MSAAELEKSKEQLAELLEK
ncbi:hypothetical protein A2U01_0119169, partial [Trifolium medium]|nr:hypothetical protein [Trifolium medium]